MVLVGNKADLEEQRQVSKEEAMNLAAEWNCAWTESSARENVNVTRGFELCIEQIEVHNTPPQESKPVCIIL
jgi:GTPase SAR1 family protein